MKINNGRQMLVLASRSPRRVELLKQIGIDCVVLPAEINESFKQDESPGQYVKRLAKEKALVTASNIKEKYSDLVVLAADTAVCVGSKVLGKPVNNADAFSMLKSLSGTKHEVHTAVAAYFSGQVSEMLSTTTVEMVHFSDDAINVYIASGECRDKAGSYAIQGRAAAWIKRIEGSYSGVMGLPLFETAELIEKVVAKSLINLN
ncbi:MAG: Maf family protein [Methylophilaceae bacterium]